MGAHGHAMGGRRARAACAAGLKKHLPVLPTARWKAHVLRIVDAGVGSLIFAFSVASVKKSFTLSFLPPGRVALIMVMTLAGQQNAM